MGRAGDIGAPGLPAGAQLSWLVENADAVSIGAIGAVAAAGTANIAPASTTTDTLTATRNGAATPSTASLVIAIGAAELPPVISEFQAADGTLKDEDGDRPDWIELRNPNPHTLVLTGCALTDTFAPGGALVQRFPADYPATLKFPKQYDRATYGLDGSGKAKYFKPGTPGAANGTAQDIDPTSGNAQPFPEAALDLENRQRRRGHGGRAATLQFIRDARGGSGHLRWSRRG